MFPGYRPRRPLQRICSLVITPQVGHCQSKKHDFVLAPASIEAKMTQRKPKEAIDSRLPELEVDANVSHLPLRFDARRSTAISPLHLPHISPTSPLHLPYISPDQVSHLSLRFDQAQYNALINLAYRYMHYRVCRGDIGEM